MWSSVCVLGALLLLQPAALGQQPSNETAVEAANATETPPPAAATRVTLPESSTVPPLTHLANSTAAPNATTAEPGKGAAAAAAPALLPLLVAVLVQCH